MIIPKKYVLSQPYQQIIDLMLNEVISRLAKQNINVKIDNSVKELIAKKGVNKSFGARPLRRTIQNLVEDSLAETILDGKHNEIELVVEDEMVVAK